MNLQLARNQKTGRIQIIDTEDLNFKQDVSNDFKYCVIKWLQSHNNQVEITKDDYITYKIKMNICLHPNI